MVRDEDEIRPDSETEYPFIDSTEDSAEDIVVLGKGIIKCLISNKICFLHFILKYNTIMI